MSSPNNLSTLRVEPLTPIRTVVETAISVDDLVLTERFYVDVLDLPVVARQPARHVFFRVGESSMLLAFLVDAALNDEHLPPHGTRGASHFALGIDRQSLDAWRQRLTEHQVSLEKEVDWPLGGHSLYFRDPSGNLAELVTPGVWGLPSGW